MEIKRSGSIAKGVQEYVGNFGSFPRMGCLKIMYSLLKWAEGDQTKIKAHKLDLDKCTVFTYVRTASIVL